MGGTGLTLRALVIPIGSLRVVRGVSDDGNGGEAGKGVLIGGGGSPSRAERPGGTGGSGGPGGPGGPRPGGREALFFVLGVIGIAAPALGTDGPPRTWSGWLLVIVGAAAGSVVATSLRDVVLTGLSRLPSRSELWRWTRAALASALALGLLVGVGIGVSRTWSWGRALLRDCGAPLEVPIVTDDDDAATARRLAAQFERVTAAEQQGCPAATLTVFTGPPPQVRAALLNGWEATAPSPPVVRGPDRELGPRPLVWLPPSTLEVDRLVDEAPGAIGIVPFARPPVWARTPIVLAAPAGGPEPPVASQPVQVRSLLADGVAVVRPDPATSAAGEFAVTASLGPPASRDPEGATVRPIEDESRRLEQELAAALARARYPLGDASAVLQAYRDLSCRKPQQRVAFLLPRQLAEHPELAGAQLTGDDCPAGDRPLTVLSSEPTLTLAHPVVVLDWPDAHGDAATAMARRFRDWLLSDDGRRAVVAVGLQPPAAAKPGGGAWPVPLDAALRARVDAALTFQDTVQRKAHVVIALDSSLSMATSLPAAQAVVDDVASRLGAEDHVGLLTFGRRVTTPVTPGPVGSATKTGNRRERVGEASVGVVPVGETPLWAGIGGALDLFGPRQSGPKAPATAVLVVTDGRIALGDAALRADVVTRARRAGTRVFVVAVGGGGCDARLAAVAADLKGICTEPDDRGPGKGLDGVATAIWGADGG